MRVHISTDYLLTPSLVPIPRPGSVTFFSVFRCSSKVVKMASDKEAKLSGGEAEGQKENEESQEDEDLSRSQGELPGTGKEAETAEKKDIAPSFSSSTVVWGGADGADLYLLDEEERHLRQRELNRVFKEKLAAYKAGKAQRGGLAGRSPSLPAVPTAVKERTAAVGMREKKAEAAGSSSTTRRSSKVVSGGLQSSGSSGAPRSAFSDVQRTRTAGETRAEPASKSAASETSGMKPEEQSVSELYIHMDSFPRDAATFQDRPAETAGVAAVAATDGPWFEPPVVSFPEKSGGERRGRHHGDKLPQLPSFYVSLHKEICCLLKLIRPTKVEEYKTLKALARLEVAASLCFPGCSCRCFGSFATNMMLPGGDVDVCILLPSSVKSLHSPPSSRSQSSAPSPEPTSNPRAEAAGHKAAATKTDKFSQKTHRSGEAKEASSSSASEATQAHAENVAHLTLLTCVLQQLGVAHGLELVSTARVPIIKYIDAATGVPLDVTINQPSSLDTTVFVQQMLRKFPLLRPLLLLAKLFLRLRNLSETYRGGAGSYLLFTMALLFLKTWQPSHDETVQREVLLSHLFVDFLFFWGKHWHYRDWGGCVRGLGHSFLKTVRPELWGGDRRELLCMESPTTPDLDLGKNAFNILNVRSAFQSAFLDLMALHLEWNEAEMQWKYDMEQWQSRRGSEGRQPAIPQVYSQSILAHLFDPAHPVFSVRKREEDDGESVRRGSPLGGKAKKEKTEQQKHEELISALSIPKVSSVQRGSNTFRRVVLCGRPSEKRDTDNDWGRGKEAAHGHSGESWRAAQSSRSSSSSSGSGIAERECGNRNGCPTSETGEEDDGKRHEGWVEIGVPVELLEEAVADFLVASTLWKKQNPRATVCAPRPSQASGARESQEASRGNLQRDESPVQSTSVDAQESEPEEMPDQESVSAPRKKLRTRQIAEEKNSCHAPADTSTSTDTPASQAGGRRESSREARNACLMKTREPGEAVLHAISNNPDDDDGEALACLYRKLRRTVKGSKDTSYTGFVTRLAAATAV